MEPAYPLHTVLLLSALLLMASRPAAPMPVDSYERIGRSVIEAIRVRSYAKIQALTPSTLVIWKRLAPDEWRWRSWRGFTIRAKFSPGYAQVLINADQRSQPCKGSPEYRQLDFWVGEWSVQTGGQTAGSSSVQRILDDCVLQENWTGAGGSSGRSFNVYNAATGKWQQTLVDDRGTVLELSGEFSQGAMRYTGTTHAKGAATEHRLTFFPLPNDRVRQLWEQSADAGQTWSITFDGVYVRR